MSPQERLEHQTLCRLEAAREDRARAEIQRLEGRLYHLAEVLALVANTLPADRVFGSIRAQLITLIRAELIGLERYKFDRLLEHLSKETSDAQHPQHPE